MADIVIEVRITNLTAAEAPPESNGPGYAALSVLRNRRGVRGTIFGLFHGHHARFLDPAPPGRVNWAPA
jgi:replicative DNA helicase